MVMGSDGLFDNVFDHEILSTIARHRDVAGAGMCFLKQNHLPKLSWTPRSLSLSLKSFFMLAKALANLASSHSMDANFDSPYSLEARSKV